MLEISLFCAILREIRVQWQKGVGLQKNSIFIFMKTTILEQLAQVVLPKEIIERFLIITVR